MSRSSRTPPRRPTLRRLRDRVSAVRQAAEERLVGLWREGAPTGPEGDDPPPSVQRAARAVRDLAGPASRLARLDVQAMRAWSRNVRPVQDTLGPAAARAYSRVVIDTAGADPELARMVAYTLPDHLARVPADQRGRYVKLLRAVLAERPVALPLVVRTLPDLLERFDDDALARFLARGIALHAESTRKAESWLRLESGAGRKQAGELTRGALLADLHRSLTLYARAHCGETVQVRPADEGAPAFTDGRHIYLPARFDRFGDERDRLAYKVLTARSAGYIEFGSLDLDLSRLPGAWVDPRPGELEWERMLRSFANPVVARDLFTIFENLRIETRVRQEYPGVARDMDALAAAHRDGFREERPDLATLAPAEQAIEWLARVALGMEPPALPDAAAATAARQAGEALARVRGPDATVLDSVAAVQAAFPAIHGLMLRSRDDGTGPEDRAPGDGSRRRHDPGDDDAGGSPPDHGDGDGDGTPRAPGAADDDELAYTAMRPDPFGAALQPDRLDPEARAVEERAVELLRAAQAEGEPGDIAEIRRQAQAEHSSYEEMAAMLDRMQAPDGGITEGTDSERIPRRDRPAGQGLELEADASAHRRTWLYPEWDAAIEDHKPDWVRLTEYDLLPGSADFAERVRDEYGHAIGAIRRAFEALRPDGARRLRGQPDGDEIDLDRWVSAVVERRAGGSPSDRLYIRHLPQERDVAVAFLVDMSSSTNEVANAQGKRVIDVEKEALVLIAEAVDAIGDDQAIWGFSGYGRDQVAFYVAKDFDDRWDEEARRRVGRIAWKMENRDGAAIRHATRKLRERGNRVKLLIILSDGKPLDCGCDQYSDRYAQEDTRAALLEARQQGVHPFCITVDPQGHEYLRRMYGETGYTVIDRVEALPRRLPLIYRRLTR
ncbi:MAG: VWA domain-containing protein [Deltaproteobacteria bacterium]|nr:MAG: VWA domain-containing protein [Deltaproteobacteria bacterium]